MNQFKTRDLLVCILPTGAGNPANPKMNVLHASEVGGGRCIPPSKDKNRREYSRCVPPSKDKQQVFTGAGIQPQLSAISNANALDRLKQAVARLQQNSKPFASA